MTDVRLARRCSIAFQLHDLQLHDLLHARLLLDLHASQCRVLEI
jgi:hypothetical protein